jgi:hypothetical protein
MAALTLSFGRFLMRATSATPFAVLFVVTVAAACSERTNPADPLTAPAVVRSHVGYKGTDVPLGFVDNNTECHIGKKGNRWPLAEQYEVRTFDAELIVAPSGVMTLICHGEIPANQPRPQQAEVEEAVLCFLPNQRDTRQAQEVFTPGGQIILTCHLNPNGN